MKKETSISSQVRERVESRLAGAVTFKAVDRFQGGWPDLEVAWRQTFYFEFKKLKRGEHLKFKSFKPLQLPTLDALERATGRSWILVYGMDVEGKKYTEVLLPSDVKNFFDEQPAAQLVEGVGRVLLTPTWDLDMAVRMIARSINS